MQNRMFRPLYFLVMFILLIVSPQIGLYPLNTGEQIAMNSAPNDSMARGIPNAAGLSGQQTLPHSDMNSHERLLRGSTADPRLSKEKNPETATDESLRDLPKDLVLWGDIADDKSVVKAAPKAVVKIHDDNIVEFALQATCKEALPAIRTFLSAYQIPIIHELTISNTFTIKVPVGWIDGVSNQFLKDAISRQDIEYIGPNTYVRLAFIPNDPEYILQWGHQTIGMPIAWDVELGSSSITVAVIDSGIDYSHRDLSNNYVGGGYDWVNLDTDPFDDNGHGTHCAGIIAAVINNSRGVAGVATLSIMAEKSFNEYGWGSDADSAAAIDHAVLAGADILSCSWIHHDILYLVTAAVERAVDAGVIVVAAAGNSGNEYLRWPACLPGVMAVGATNGPDELASFSSYGTWVDVTAPGVGILSTLPDNQYGYADGTSMATPYVAGLAGLLMSHYPSYSPDQIQWLIRTTATDLGDPGKDRYFGWGRINASSAINGLPSHNLRAWGFSLYYEEPERYMPYPGPVPDTVSMGFGTKFYGYAVNLGLFSESGVSLRIYANGTLAASTNAPSLNGGDSLTLPFHFQPTKEGNYNITIAVDTVFGESDVTDNIEEIWISVTFPRDYVMEPKAAVWLDALTYGTNIWLYGDDAYTSVSLPFAFPFYGRTFDTVYVSSNGWLSFTNPTPWEFWPSSFPSTNPEHQYVIAPFWYDLIAQNNVFTWLTPTHAVIEFIHYKVFQGFWEPSEEIGTFQVVMYPNGTIDFNYLTIITTRGGYLVSIGDPEATVGLNHGGESGFCSTYPVDNLLGVTNFALRFTPAGGPHELQVELQPFRDWTMEPGPQNCVMLNQPKTINVSVSNLGTTDEPNIDLRLYINDLMVTSEVIPLLASLNRYVMNYTWIPNTLGANNITVYVVPLSGEFTETNNQWSRWVHCVIVHDYLVTKTDTTTWYDAVTNGYRLPLSGYFSEQKSVSLPFTFPFYDKTFDTVYVNTDGWLSFYNADNWRGYPTAFPSADPQHQYFIAPFWESLQTNPSNMTDAYDDIYVWSTADWLVIQYNNYTYNWGEPFGTFEVVLHADGLIEFHYQKLFSCTDCEGVVGLNYGNGIHYTSIPLSWIIDTTDESLTFTYPAPHDLTVSAGASSHLEFGDAMLINATLRNRGLTNEMNLDFFLLINDVLVATDTIPQLPPGNEYALQFPWAPTTMATYNITVYVPAVLNETRIINNRHTVLCTYADTLPPTWIAAPTNQILLSGQQLFLQLNATDRSGIASWSVNNTLHFAIDNTGLLTSTPLPPGIHTLTINVTDPYDNTCSATITITKLPDFPVFPIIILALLSATIVLMVLIAEHYRSDKTP